MVQREKHQCVVLKVLTFTFHKFLYGVLFLDSSMVEHSAVNRVVVGSSPTRGVIWLHGQAVKTSPFHGGNTGSIPVGVIAFNAYCISWMHTIEYGDLAKW